MKSLYEGVKSMHTRFEVPEQSPSLLARAMSLSFYEAAPINAQIILGRILVKCTTFITQRYMA